MLYYHHCLDYYLFTSTAETKKGKVCESQQDHLPPSKRHCSESLACQEETVLDNSSATAGLLKQFASDLEVARTRLAVGASSHSESVEVSTTTVSCDSSTTATSDCLTNGVDPLPSLCQVSTDTPLKPSFGHRAGFDAFMTGYVFAYYTLTQAKDWPTAGTNCKGYNEAMIAGLSPMRNRLNNGNRAVPLILAKSQFVKNSQAHRENLSKMAEFKNNIIS